MKNQSVWVGDSLFIEQRSNDEMLKLPIAQILSEGLKALIPSASEAQIVNNVNEFICELSVDREEATTAATRCTYFGQDTVLFELDRERFVTLGQVTEYLHAVLNDDGNFGTRLVAQSIDTVPSLDTGEICWRRDVSFAAYTKLDSDYVIRPLDGFEPMVVPYVGQFDYAATLGYAGGEYFVDVPIDDFCTFIEPGYMTDEISAYVSAAKRAGAGHIAVAWNEENEQTKPYCETHTTLDGELVVVTVELPIGLDELQISAHYGNGIGTPEAAIRLAVDSRFGVEPLPLSFAASELGRALIAVVANSAIGVYKAGTQPAAPVVASSSSSGTQASA